jgi:hypothetical protein
MPSADCLTLVRMSLALFISLRSLATVNTVSHRCIGCLSSGPEEKKILLFRIAFSLVPI